MLRQRPRARLTFGGAVGVAVVLVGALTTVLVAPVASAQLRDRVSNVVTVSAALAVPLSCAWAARRSSGRIRLGWRLMSAAGACWTLAELIWLVETYVFRSDAAPAVSDVFYLAALLPTAAALLVFPPPQPSRAERTRMLLGALVVGSAVLVASRTLLLSVTVLATNDNQLAQAVDLAYPASDVMLVSLSLIALVRVGPRARWPILLLAAGILVYSVSDTLHVRQTALGHYASGSLLGVGWVVGYLLFALAALAPQARSDQQPSVPRRSRRMDWSSLAVYLPVLAAAAVAGTFPSPHPDLLLILASVAMVVVFGVRQALLTGDNGRLREDLQGRVGQLETQSVELRRLASENERVVLSVADGVFRVDTRGVVSFVNPRAEIMLGRAAAELVGLPEAELFAAPARPDVVPATREAALDLGAEQTAAGSQFAEVILGSEVARVLATGSVVSGTRARFRRGDGSTFPVELAVGPILEAGRVSGAVVVFRDVSARVAVEKMKNEFVSVVSHELRTPLTSIRGSLGLLVGGVGGQLSTQGTRLVTIALESSERLSRLIEDMLDLERMESGSLSIDPLPCEVASLVNTALNEVDGLARQYEVRLATTGVEGTVRVDADRIVQTLTNLLGNAIKFSPPGATVTVSGRQRDAMVELAVSDQGRGIPEHKIDRIFERFEQVDSSDARQRGGTGLGLTISRDIVALHGGAIWAESEFGRGSTFRFTLPGRLRSADPGPALDERQELDEVLG